jgi:adenylate cyclase
MIIILWLQGYPEQAIKKKQEMLSLANELSHSYSLAHAWFFSVWLNILCRNFPLAQKETEILTEVSKDIISYFPFAKFMRSWVLAIQGNEKIDNSYMHQLIDTVEVSGVKVFMPFYFALIAETSKNFENQEEGLQALKKAKYRIDKTEERYWEAEIHRLKGELLLSQLAGNQGEVESCFQKAIKISRLQQAKSFELRAAISLSRLWQNQGKTEKARDLLSEIYGWFTEGFDTADLKDAKALLEEFS